MAFFNVITEWLGQEVVPHKHHDEYKVIDHSIDVEVFDRPFDLLELEFKVLPQDVYEHHLEDCRRLFSQVGLSGLYRIYLYAFAPYELLSDNVDVVDPRWQHEEEQIGVWRVDAMRWIFIEKSFIPSDPHELQNLLLSLAWGTTVWVNYI